MGTLVLTCANCGFPLATPVSEPTLSVECGLCLNTTQVQFFPALLSEPAKGAAAELLLVDSESSCFYHADKKASMACEHCGRFLCALCDIDFNGRHVCSSCIEMGLQDNQSPTVQRKMFYFDELALSLVVYPLLFPYVIPLTAPIGLALALRFWNRQNGFLPRTRWRFVAAILMAVLELVAFGLIVVMTGSL